jgi:hypothetical protein
MMAGAELVMTAGLLMATIALLSLAGLKAWRDWLDLRRLELGRERIARPSPARARLDLADLKDRVRRLEAIANGAEL